MSKIDEELDKVNYSFGFLFKTKWISYLIGLFILTTFMYIPFSNKIDSIVYSSLSGIPGCPVQMTDYHFELFLPKIVLQGATIKGSCIGQTDDLNLKSVSIYMRGLSLSPFGPSFKIKTNIFKSEIEAIIIPGIGSVSILLENESSGGKFPSPINKLNLAELGDFIPKLRLSGDLVISTGFIKMGYDGKLGEITLNIASNNFQIPGQKISGFRISPMQLNNFLLQVTSGEKGKLLIKKFILGDEKSPIITDFSGDLQLNMKKLDHSRINIRGELAISKKFEEDYFIVKSYLNKFDKKDKFYQIQVKGILNSPNITTAR